MVVSKGGNLDQTLSQTPKSEFFSIRNKRTVLIKGVGDNHLKSQNIRFEKQSIMFFKERNVVILEIIIKKKENGILFFLLNCLFF